MKTQEFPFDSIINVHRIASNQVTQCMGSMPLDSWLFTRSISAKKISKITQITPILEMNSRDREEPVG